LTWESIEFNGAENRYISCYQIESNGLVNEISGILMVWKAKDQNHDTCQFSTTELWTTTNPHNPLCAVRRWYWIF